MVGAVTAPAMIRSASRCSARSSEVESGCQVLEVTPTGERRCERVEALQQLGGAALADRNRRGHGDAQFRREAIGIDGDAAVARQVEHVENQQHRPADALQLQHQANAEAEIGRIRDADDAVGRGFVADAENHVARDLLVRTAASQRIGAGQIDDRDAASGRRHERSRFALDGHARIIGGALPAAGEGVEQRGLAAVRRSDQREIQRCRELRVHRINRR